MARPKRSVRRSSISFLQKSPGSMRPMTSRCSSVTRPSPTAKKPTQDHEGQRLWYLTTKLPLRDASGVIGLLGISQDITLRKETEQALRVSEEPFRFLNNLV